MMCNPNLVRLECSTVSQTVTIVPRLDYSNYLLGDIMDTLKRKKTEIKKSNLASVRIAESKIILPKCTDNSERF